MVLLLGHRDFIPADCRFRQMKGPFDGTEEHRDTPDPPSGFEVYDQVKGLQVTFGNIQWKLYQVGGSELQKEEHVY